MNTLINKWLKKSYPRNYLIRHPYQGAGIITLFLLGFVIIYRPLESHETGVMTYPQTMAIYCMAAGVSILGSILLFRRIVLFSVGREWTFGKEILFILLVLTGMGTAIYFIGFLVEPPADRWNIPTFLDSLINALLVGILPFLFFTALNYRYLLYPAAEKPGPGLISDLDVSPGEEPMNIQSKLKREALDFFPGQFLYAESDGNYVHFHLMVKGEPKRKTIRNSISDIERQFSGIPWFFRTHRAYIVNLKKVVEKQGNASGYRLKLEGTHFKVPVSRTNTGVFDKKFKFYHT